MECDGDSDAEWDKYSVGTSRCVYGGAEEWGFIDERGWVHSVYESLSMQTSDYYTTIAEHYAENILEGGDTSILLDAVGLEKEVVMVT